MGRHCHLEYQLTHETVPTSHCLSDLSLPKCHNTNRPELRATVATLLTRALWPFQTVLFERLHFLLTLCQYHRKPPAIAGYQGNSFPVIPALPSVNSSFSADACLTGWASSPPRRPGSLHVSACFSQVWKPAAGHSRQRQLTKSLRKRVFHPAKGVLCQGKVVEPFWIAPARWEMSLCSGWNLPHMILLCDLMEHYALGFVYLKWQLKL